MKKGILVILIGILFVTGGPLPAAAKKIYLNSRDQAMEYTLNSYVERNAQLTFLLEDDTGYMHAEAFHLYSRGRFKAAIDIWNDILAINPDNTVARFYIEDAKEKQDARYKTKELTTEEERGIRSMRQKKLGPTQGQYSHTKLAYNELAPHLTMGEHRSFDQSVSFLRNEQKYATRTNRETSSLAHNMRVNTTSGDYNSIFTMSGLYDHTTRDDVRLPRYINWMMENDNFRFLVGDNSTYLSRYVLSGMGYRGIEWMTHTDTTAYPIDRFKVLYGWGKAYDTQSEDYFLPIEVFGLRNEVEFNPRYKVGISFANIVQEDKITRVDQLFRPRNNLVASIDQYLKLADWWVVRHELGLSRLSDEVTRFTIQKEIPTTTGWAQYFSSNILKDTWQLYNTYEYGSTNFTSLAGQARFFHNAVPSDREIFENTFIWTPVDEVLFELQYHRLRNNLGSEQQIETTKENMLKALVQLRPKNWMPTIGLRSSYCDIRSIPGSDQISPNHSYIDAGVELSKKVYGFDWVLGYTLQKSVEDLPAFGDGAFNDIYRNTYSVSLAKQMLERMYMRLGYSYADLDMVPTTGDNLTNVAYENRFDYSVTMGLWGSSNVSLGYHYFNRRDYLGVFEDLDSHTGSLVFSWPYTYTFFNKQKFTLTPYLSYYYSKNDEFTQTRRSHFASRIDADYLFNPNNKLNLVFEYLNGVDKSIFNEEGDEVRFMATYRTVSGF
jgi:hypothetical protein